MNFKIFLSGFFLFLLAGCGVKSDPIPPAGTFLPSVESHYMEKPQDKIEESKKEEEEEEENKKTKADKAN